VVQGVADGLAHEAFWEVAAFDFLKVAADEAQAGGAVAGTGGVA
jgi:hypothetical protein